ncbi:nuclear transport factor 2 family protein [Muricoccus aerilatus]|uniref:nuclear transport factor 2 family protein n=1 Tax=Muricoccus aerilatus TaxID=452982 RepID=UPI000A82032D|nr:nuclear transport factor 2 family protein [Roseomonas aerilata]
MPITLALGLAAAPAPAPAPAHAQAAAIDASTQVRNEDIVRRAFEGWAAGRSGFVELLAPDVVWTIHGSGPVAGIYRSREDFVERASRPLMTRLATPLVPKVHHIWAFGDTVIIRFEAAATTTSGDAYSNQFVWIFTMRNGIVVEAEAFLDLVAYQRAVDTSEAHRP